MSVLEVLRGDAGLDAWLKQLDERATADGTRPAPALPDPVDLPDLLLDLWVPHPDVAELIALRARLDRDPELRTLVERAARSLVHGMGEVDGTPLCPPLPAELGAAGRYFHVLVYLAALPSVRAYHRAHGIPDDVSRRTLADLGRHIGVHRRRYGTGGLVHPQWLQLHFRGEIYQLGRLQFQRARLGKRTGTAVAESGGPAGPGDAVLSVHIPDFAGPFPPEACDAALDQAREFFPRHFPDERYDVAVCYSWLLDPQLPDHLSDRSNIVRFQRRFQLCGTDGDGPSDRSAVEFTFGDPELPYETLPGRTSLERAIGDHLRAGGHWWVGKGWFEL
ncbi:acyltransferase domain-containing protein [Streptomyces boninensis]|uniref:acyltransferase domain-containing protein n=1 Tax=Streptomyces boninensis TaxID=2039455 RepID=UPI003B215EC2